MIKTEQKNKNNEYFTQQYKLIMDGNKNSNFKSYKATYNFFAFPKFERIQSSNNTPMK